MGGVNNTDLYRIDVTFQASLPNETLTVVAGCQGYGQGFWIPAATLSTIPAPASLGLLTLGALAMLLRRRA